MGAGLAQVSASVIYVWDGEKEGKVHMLSLGGHGTGEQAEGSHVHGNTLPGQAGGTDARLLPPAHHLSTLPHALTKRQTPLERLEVPARVPIPQLRNFSEPVFCPAKQKTHKTLRDAGLPPHVSPRFLADSPPPPPCLQAHNWQTAPGCTWHLGL